MSSQTIAVDKSRQRPSILRSSKQRANWPVTLLLIAGACIFVIGILYIAVVVALKTPAEMANVLAWPQTIRWANFSEAWQITNYPQKFLNTFTITAINLVFTLVTNAAVGYAIGRNRLKNRFFNIIYYYFLSAMFIPFHVLMLPLVKQADALGLDNILGISLLYIVFGLPTNTFLYVGFIKSLPEAVDEAAMIDGANPFQIFMQIIFPMMKPMHATVAILSVMWTWNDFLMPLILLTKPDNQTLQLSQYVFQGQFSTNYNLAFASYMLVLLPVLIIYIFCQKWIIAGVASGSVKA